MNGVILKCPLCCNKSFDSKSELTEHLTSVLDNLTCSICNSKWSSIEHLIEHLTLDNCHPDTVDIIFDIDTNNVNNENVSETSNCNLDALSDNKLLNIDAGDGKTKLNDPFATNNHSDNIMEGQEVGKMYVELLSKQLTNSCLQTQELKLIKDNGVSRYVVMTNEDDDLGIGSTVVTKQNQDGTISLTTVRDTKLESDSEAMMKPEDVDLDDQQEVYSCSSCGVSFTSVIDHIKNYHNDQDVVVEEQVEETGNKSITIYNSQLTTEELTTEKQIRRMITETGDIVEAPLVVEVLKPSSTIHFAPSEVDNKIITEIKEELRGQAMGNFNAIIENDLNVQQKKNGPFHKVVMKEMQTVDKQKVTVYNCLICKVYVSTLEEFKSRPCNILKYSCPKCPVGYDNAKSLNAHMKVHKLDKTVVDIIVNKDPASIIYECTVCGTIFPTHKSLKLHKRMHDPIKSRPIEPPVEISDGSEVSKDKYLCTICNKVIPMDYREIHQNSHKDIQTFNCDICNKKFSGQDYLEMHLNAHSVDKVLINKQDESLPYRCLYCERRFARPHEKVKHERIHTGEKPHSCEICGKSFRVSYCLTLHMRTHTGARPYACTHCGKRFKAHSVYNHHLLTHSDVRAYKCPYCPKAFKTSVQLAGHKNSHTKPFSCQQCNRPFASLYAVRVHTETHARQNNLKFSCSLCGASYARAFALKDHIRQVHNKETDK